MPLRLTLQQLRKYNIATTQEKHIRPVLRLPLQIDSVSLRVLALDNTVRASVKSCQQQSNVVAYPARRGNCLRFTAQDKLFGWNAWLVVVRLP
jgi:hypothetical protein